MRSLSRTAAISTTKQSKNGLLTVVLREFKICRWQHLGSPRTPPRQPGLPAKPKGSTKSRSRSFPAVSGTPPPVPHTHPQPTPVLEAPALQYPGHDYIELASCLCRASLAFAWWHHRPIIVDSSHGDKAICARNGTQLLVLYACIPRCPALEVTSQACVPGTCKLHVTCLACLGFWQCGRYRAATDVFWKVSPPGPSATRIRTIVPDKWTQKNHSPKTIALPEVSEPKAC